MASASADTPATGESFKSVFGRRLEPYLALSKSAKGAGCVQLIKDVLTAPGVVVFGELLAMPNVVEVTHPTPVFFVCYYPEVVQSYLRVMTDMYSTH